MPRHAQSIYDDSAGRPVKLTGQRDAGPVTTYWEAANPSGAAQGAYDPLGRIPSLKADSGLVTSARQYDAYSGLLTHQNCDECRVFISKKMEQEL